MREWWWCLCERVVVVFVREWWWCLCESGGGVYVRVVFM